MQRATCEKKGKLRAAAKSGYVYFDDKLPGIEGFETESSEFPK